MVTVLGALLEWPVTRQRVSEEGALQQLCGHQEVPAPLHVLHTLKLESSVCEVHLLRPLVFGGTIASNSTSRVGGCKWGMWETQAGYQCWC